MGARSQVEKKIQAKQQEIAELEAKIQAAGSYIQAMQEVLRLLPKDDAEAGGAEQLLRHGSAMAHTRDLLLKAGKPLHITAILEGIGRENTKSQRLSVSGSLRSYARKGQIFTQEGGNVFGLVEFKSSPSSSVSSSVRGVPPKGFGLSSEEEAA